MFVRKFSFLLLGSFLAHSNAGATHEMKTVNWELINEKLPMPLSDMSATYDEATGLIFLVGGCDDPQGNSQLTPDLFICNSITEKGYSFNPIDGEFKELPPAPRARYRHTASNVEGKIWLVGGRTLEDLVIPEVDIYDPAENSWSTFGILPPDLQFSDQGSFYSDNYLYVVGGYEQDYAAKDTTFRIPTDSMEDGLTTETMAPLADVRGDIHVVVLDDFAYTAGGYTHEDGHGGFCVPHSSTERYDIKNNVWMTIDDLDTGRADKALVALDGRIFALGGETKETDLCSGDVAEYTMALNDVEVLEDPHKDESHWHVVADAPTRVFRFTGSHYPPTQSIYTFGGQKFYNPSCECFATSDEITKYVFVEEAESSPANSVSFSKVVSSAIGIIALFQMIY